MAEITVKVRVCDVCGDQSKETKRYSLGEGQRKAVKDLCADDAGPIEALMGDGKALAKKAPERAASRRPRINVTSIEEIEKLRKR